MDFRKKAKEEWIKAGQPSYGHFASLSRNVLGKEISESTISRWAREDNWRTGKDEDAKIVLIEMAYTRLDNTNLPNELRDYGNAFFSMLSDAPIAVVDKYTPKMKEIRAKIYTALRRPDLSPSLFRALSLLWQKLAGDIQREVSIADGIDADALIIFGEDYEKYN